MPTLHVRNVPEELYRRLQEQAEKENRSLSAEIIYLLQSVVHSLHHRRRQTEILRELREHRFTPPADAPDSTMLLREDRER